MKRAFSQQKYSVYLNLFSDYSQSLQEINLRLKILEVALQTSENRKIYEWRKNGQRLAITENNL